MISIYDTMGAPNAARSRRAVAAGAAYGATQYTPKRVEALSGVTVAAAVFRWSHTLVADDHTAGFGASDIAGQHQAEFATGWDGRGAVRAHEG